MIKYGILAAIFVLVIAAVAATFRPEETAEIYLPTLSDIGQGDWQQRLFALEDAIKAEQQLSSQLKTDLAKLQEQNTALAERVANISENRRNTVPASVEGIPEDVATLREQITQRRNGGSAQDAGDRQLAALTAAGFDEYQAAEIVRLSEEAQMRLLNARYEAEQKGEQFDPTNAALSVSQQMRTSLGDSDYEKYLEATRQPTSVAVSNVLASSPAQLAGLQAGDQITSYNGERVFNINELNTLTNSVDGSSKVVVEVLRDGQPVSISLPAGPIGIVSGRGNFQPGIAPLAR